MTNHVPEQTRKNDEKTLAVLSEHVSAVEAFIQGLEEKKDKLTNGQHPFDVDSHSEVSYQISKLTLIADAFKVHIRHIKACQDVEAIVFREIHNINNRISEINRRSTGKYWWNKFKWFGESARAIATTIASVGIIYAALLTGLITIGGGK